MESQCTQKAYPAEWCCASFPLLSRAQRATDVLGHATGRAFDEYEDMAYGVPVDDDEMQSPDDFPEGIGQSASHTESRSEMTLAYEG
eukprot:8960401-Karenia_brevis.AAC.1